MGGIKSGNRQEWNGGDGRGQHVVLNIKYGGFARVTWINKNNTSDIFFFNLTLDLLSISNLDPLWWQIKHKWASRSKLKAALLHSISSNVRDEESYLLSCWVWRIRVHSHWRRRMSWWNPCGAKRRPDPHHTSLQRERHTEGEGERWEIKQFLTFPQRKFMLHYYLIIYMNPNKRSGLGQHFDSFVKVIHFQRALQGTLVHLDGLLPLHVLNIPSAKLHN